MAGGRHPVFSLESRQHGKGSKSRFAKTTQLSALPTPMALAEMTAESKNGLGNMM